ncbi:GntR family transcriptional regulator [Reyranella soli]|jgi:DNA-binding GntR family transcriptional regulator|uniref:Transcriptional regulator n=1 Tax=Reyranella soli TaxID=1230389 RepID=A0A512N482_9HYPH|nr:GntR family transcriptional regulator [Reyranella soli]GEP53786.1 transcriptional regulator [Reyranella soli]
MQTDNPTLTEKLASAIADGILDGSLTPGLRLDENSLARQYGVSRTPVREALRQLMRSGLIDMRPRKGAVVSKATPGQVESLFVAMAEMEATCARLAAMSMTPVERRRLQARHEAMTALAAAGDRAAYSDANVAFHSAIYAGAHNEPIAEYTLGLRRRVGPFRRAQFNVDGRLVLSNREHDTVVRAILSGDAAGAHAAMLHHVSLVEDAFETFAATSAA